MVVLILAQSNDQHAQAVSEKLKSLDAEHVIWSYSDFTGETSFAFSTSLPSTNWNRVCFGEDRQYQLQDISSIWFRRPGQFKSKLMPEPWVENMIESECRNAIGGILRSRECLLVNHPGRDADSLYKLVQLEQAQRFGLSVPDTLVTNEPHLVSEFYEKHDGKVIYKLIGENSNFCFPRFEFPAGIPTLPFRATDLQHLEQVRLAPHLFQQRIEKDFEVRATVVGKEIFAVRIDSQKGSSKLDWRMDYAVPMEAMKLPSETCRAMLELMRFFQLEYAAFDFCVDTNGIFQFLELNCGGQYLWLEHRTGLEISQQVALLLTGRAESNTECFKRAT